MTAIVWFRRDLRVNDNPALSAAMSTGEPVYGIYIFAPEEEAPWSPGAASRWYLQQSLVALQKSLQALGIPLVFLRSDSAQGLLGIAANTDAHSVFYNLVHEPLLHKRDEVVNARMEKAGLSVSTFQDYSLFSPGIIRTAADGPYKVFTPYWRRLASKIHEMPDEQGIFAQPHEQKPPKPVGSSSIKNLRILVPHSWQDKLAAHHEPGEQAAHNQLELFLAQLENYPEGRDLPAGAHTSRLSAPLHFGEISPWRIRYALQQSLQGENGALASKAAESFLRQIGWREFAINLLNTYPHSSDKSLHKRFDDSGIWFYDKEMTRAWQRGKTGFAIVDAGMHELWETGIMHNRVRMVAASLLTKNMGQHWIHGARWFWDTLVDADLANNSMGWQWVAGCGCDAAPYFRVFNPETQAKRFDPAGEYLSRWLPPEQLSNPIVDLAASRNEALERYKRLPAAEKL